jgi:hypothetical protein
MLVTKRFMASFPAPAPIPFAESISDFYQKCSFASCAEHGVGDSTFSGAGAATEVRSARNFFEE